MNKVLNAVSGLVIVVGFLLMVGVAGAQDYAIECGEYLPWYYGWQQMLISLLMMAGGAFVCHLTYTEE